MFRHSLYLLPTHMFSHQTNKNSLLRTKHLPFVSWRYLQILDSDCTFPRVRQVSLINLLATLAGQDGLQAFKTMRTLRALRPLRAMSRMQGMKVSQSRSPGTQIYKLYTRLRRPSRDVMPMGGVKGCSGAWQVTSSAGAERKTRGSWRLELTYSMRNCNVVLNIYN